MIAQRGRLLVGATLTMLATAALFLALRHERMSAGCGRNYQLPRASHKEQHRPQRLSGSNGGET